MAMLNKQMVYIYIYLFYDYKVGFGDPDGWDVYFSRPSKREGNPGTLEPAIGLQSWLNSNLIPCPHRRSGMKAFVG